MPIKRAYAGEDVSIRQYYDDPSTGDPTDPAAAPEVTVTGPDDTAHVDAVAMTSNGTGDYEHVWDTDANSTGAGVYTVETTAEFDSETKIMREKITLE